MNLCTARYVSIRPRLRCKSVHCAQRAYGHVSNKNLYATPRVITDTCSIKCCVSFWTRERGKIVHLSTCQSVLTDVKNGFDNFQSFNAYRSKMNICAVCHVSVSTSEGRSAIKCPNYQYLHIKVGFYAVCHVSIWRRVRRTFVQ